MSQLSNIRTVSTPSLGKLALIDKPGSFTPSGKHREHKAGRLAADGGWVEAYTPAALEVTINLVPGVDVVAINSLEGEDVTVRLSSGQVYMMARAWVESAVQIGDGQAQIIIKSNTSEKI